MRDGVGQAPGHVLPVGDVPDGLDVVALDIEVVKVEGVLNNNLSFWKSYKRFYDGAFKTL